MTCFNIDALKFARAALCASTEATRYYLNGVYIEPHADGVLLVATDGHKMAVLLDRSGSCNAPVVVPVPKALISAIGRAKKQSPRLRVEANGDNFRLESLSEDFLGSVPGPVSIECDYPDFRRVAPSVIAGKGSKGWASFNSDYLQIMGRILSPNSKSSQITAYTTGPNDPTIVKGSDEDAFCVLMPIRSKLANDVEKHRPQDWFYPTAKPQDATEEKENCDAL